MQKFPRVKHASIFIRPEIIISQRCRRVLSSSLFKYYIFIHRMLHSRIHVLTLAFGSIIYVHAYTTPTVYFLLNLLKLLIEDAFHSMPEI